MKSNSPLQKENYWFAYTGSNFIPNPQMRDKATGRPTNTRIHNEIDQPSWDKPKKCSYYRNKGHHKETCQFRQ